MEEYHVDKPNFLNFMVTQNVNYDNDQGDSFEDIIIEYFSRPIKEVDSSLRKDDDG